MLLIVTGSGDATANFVEEKLVARDLAYFRFNTEDFPTSLQLIWEGGPKNIRRRLITSDQEIDLSRIRSIWWRRPFDPGPQISPDIADERAREFAELQTTESLRMLWDDLQGKRWVSHPSHIRIANSKLLQLRKARELGIKTPKSLLTNSPEQAKQFIEQNQQTVIKALRQKPILSGNDWYGFYTAQVSTADLRFISEVKYAPVLLQERVPKEKEIRLTIVGKQIYAASVRSLELDWRKEDPKMQEWKADQIPANLQIKFLQMLQEFNLLFGTIDLIVTPQGEYVFLELNPNGQWAWIEIETGLPISEGLIKLFYQE